MLIAFMKDEIGFISSNKVSDTWIFPEGGIRQGDSLSPSIYVMITALLCILIKRAVPSATALLYADYTLLCTQIVCWTPK